jgi:hypothetical protein
MLPKASALGWQGKPARSNPGGEGHLIASPPARSQAERSFAARARPVSLAPCGAREQAHFIFDVFVTLGRTGRARPAVSVAT